MDDVLATRLDEPDGGDHIHARLSGDNCYGEAKFARITGWLADNAITREDAHIRAYSDHVSDHPMLRFADEAVATTQSRKLRRPAPRMGWQVVDLRGRKLASRPECYGQIGRASGRGMGCQFVLLPVVSVSV